jgi:hypothetical protein
MIENASQLYASLHQLSSMVDSLQAAHLDCEKRNDWRLFPLMSEGLVIRIRELNAEIRAYLGSRSDGEPVGTAGGTQSVVER